MNEAVELYSGSLAARLMPTVVDEMSRNPELAEIARDRFLTGRRAALRRSSNAASAGVTCVADLDVELALDVLGGPLSTA